MVMKNLIVAVAALFMTSLAHAGSGLAFSVVLDRDNLSGNVAKVLETKLQTSLSSAGIPSAGDAGLFLKASFSQVGEHTVEGGMRKIKTCTYVLCVSVVHPVLEHTFGSMTFDLEGVGFDADKAATDAVRKIYPQAPQFVKFLLSSQDMASAYYRDNIGSLIAKARTLASAKDYDAAVALLWSLPQSSEISSAAYSALNEIFAKMQREQCSSLLQQARNAYALKNYDAASACLDAIDPLSECGTEAQKLMTDIGNEIRTAEREAAAMNERAAEREAAMRDKELQRRHDTARQAASAIAAVASAYYQSRRTVVVLR